MTCSLNSPFAAKRAQAGLLANELCRKHGISYGCNTARLVNPAAAARYVCFAPE